MFERLRRVRLTRRRAVLLSGIVLLGMIGIYLAVSGTALGKQRTLTQSLQNVVNTETFHTTAELKLMLPTRQNTLGEQSIVSVGIKFNGDMAQDQGRPVLAGDMRLDALGRGMILFTDGDIRFLRDTVAFRLENLPALLNPRGNLLEKWTHVNVPVFETSNPDSLTMALALIAGRANYTGREYLGDEKLHRYDVRLTPEEEDALYEIFRQRNSGNRALHVLARLMNAYDISSFVVLVEAGDKEVRRLHLTFARSQENSDQQMAELSLTFSDYGREVAIEEPPIELTVRPDVFARMFGQGEVPETIE
ncbi:MAG: hypothetical protein ACRD4B_08320 [Acidobacteriota bacterium]